MSKCKETSIQIQLNNQLHYFPFRLLLSRKLQGITQIINLACTRLVTVPSHFIYLQFVYNAEICLCKQSSNPLSLYTLGNSFPELYNDYIGFIFIAHNNYPCHNTYDLLS
jgi:hypothetical protein